MERQFRDQIEAIARECGRYSDSIGGIPGLSTPESRIAFARQCVDSLRRVHFVHAIEQRDISQERLDPVSSQFDPIRGAVLKRRNGELEEAIWLVFLATHFGKHRRYGWITTAQVYGGANPLVPWTYARIINHVPEFLSWLDDAGAKIPRFVGNHRKYLSLSARKPYGTGATISSYIEWAQRYGSQINAIQFHIDKAEEDERLAFSRLYDSLRIVTGFGRTARFDFLCMLEKTGLAKITADRAYLEEATGPLRGAALLFRGNASNTKNKRGLDDSLCEFGEALGLPPNIMEDAVCNWQKNPNRYVPFRG